MMLENVLGKGKSNYFFKYVCALSLLHFYLIYYSHVQACSRSFKNKPGLNV